MYGVCRSLVVLVRRRRLVVEGLVTVVVVDGRFGVMTSDLLDHRLEPVHVVGGVLDHTGGTVGLDQAVRALDGAVSVALLVLVLDVVCVRVLDVVPEFVRGRNRVVVVLAVVVVVVVVVPEDVSRMVVAKVVSRMVLRRVGQRRLSAMQGDEDDDQLEMSYLLLLTVVGLKTVCKYQETRYVAV